MKKLVLFIAALLVLYSCGKLETEPIQNIEGYIVAFDQCTAPSRVNGFYIVSTNLKDTILTYNLPDSLFNIPRSYFQGWMQSPYLADSLRFKFKLNASYTFTKKEDIYCFPCIGIISTAIRNKYFYNAKEVKIKSAIKLETKK